METNVTSESQCDQFRIFINASIIKYMKNLNVSRNLYTFAHRLNQLEEMANLNRLKVVLVEHGKTGRWLAKELGKSTCTISKWCSNTIQPDLQTLNDIANLLNIEVSQLLVSNKND